MRKSAAVLVLAALLCCGGESIQSQSSAWELLKGLLPIPGVSGEERLVADFIQDALSSCCDTQRDEMDNVWFTAGEGRPHLLFVAHTDELGWIVSAVTSDGLVKVRSRGSLLVRASEAQAVTIYTDEGPVNGILSPREGYDERRPPGEALPSFETQDFAIDVGLRSEAAVRELGISEGCQVTIRKNIVDLTSGILAARAVDDRAGCAALLDAALRMNWKKLEGKTVTFAWDVQEEIGLIGASALTKIMQPDVVFPVDTFVSTDSPLESKRFGYLPLGGGAVIRAIDSSTIVPKTEIRKVMDIARKRGIPVQTGNTRGGNDGSVFLAGGAVNIPLSWPGVYSHSFIEKIDRRDLEALADLILALVEGWK